MAKQTTPLSPTLLDSLKNKDKLVRMYDGNGLILEIRALPSKKKVWRFKYPHPITKKDILLTLGEYPALSLKNARAKRSEYLAMLADKLDPREQLQIEQDKLENATSLEKVTRLWHTEQTAKGKWGGDTGHKTLRKFENHLFPLIGELPIEEIRTHDLTKALTIIDNKGVNRVARDLRANLVRIFIFAIQHDYIRHNPARELDGLITARKVKHHPALPHDRLNEMSHKERDKTRLAYTHMAEFLEERKEMMYWWSNYLERNKKGYISPHDYGVQTKLDIHKMTVNIVYDGANYMWEIAPSDLMPITTKKSMRELEGAIKDLDNLAQEYSEDEEYIPEQSMPEESESEAVEAIEVEKEEAL